MLPFMASAAAFSPAAFSSANRAQLSLPRQVPRSLTMMEPVAAAPAGLAAGLLLLADTQDAIAQLEQFQQSHAFLLSIIFAIATRLIILEIRRQVEKPVMDKLGEAAKEQLTPDTEQVGLGAWVQLAGCIALDLAGDASVRVSGLPTGPALQPILQKTLRGACSDPGLAGAHPIPGRVYGRGVCAGGGWSSVCPVQESAARRPWLHRGDLAFHRRRAYFLHWMVPSKPMAHYARRAEDGDLSKGQGVKRHELLPGNVSTVVEITPGVRLGAAVPEPDRTSLGRLLRNARRCTRAQDRAPRPRHCAPEPDARDRDARPRPGPSRATT
jgi:hypothetical protein